MPAPTPPLLLPRRRPRRLAVLAALGAGLLVVAGVALAVPPRARPAGPARVEDAGDGQTVTVAPGAVASVRQVAVTVRGRPVAGQEFEGRGDAVVAVVAPRAEGGRVLVGATSNGLAPIAWRALVVVPRPDGSEDRIVIARGLSAAQPDVPASSTFAYAHRPPTRIAVSAPADVRWTLQVGIADGPESELR